jgi:hypothetical protein
MKIIEVYSPLEEARKAFGSVNGSFMDVVALHDADFHLKKAGNGQTYEALSTTREAFTEAVRNAVIAYRAPGLRPTWIAPFANALEKLFLSPEPKG